MFLSPKKSSQIYNFWISLILKKLMFSGMAKYLGKKLQWKIGEVSEQYLRILLEHISPVSVSSLILCNLLFHSWFFKILVWGNESTLSSLVVKLKLENKIASSHMQNWGLLSTFRVAIWPILVLNLVKMINAFFFPHRTGFLLKWNTAKKEYHTICLEL